MNSLINSELGIPLTVGLLIDDSLDRPDGVQQYVLTLGDWLTKNGHAVHYITGATERTDLTNLHNIGKTISVKFNGNRLTTPLPASRRKIKSLVKQLNLDVLHVMVPYSPLLAGRVIGAMPDDGKTIIVGSHMIYPESKLVTAGAKVLAAIQRRQSKKFDAMMAVSEAAQEFARKTFHQDSEVIGIPVNISAFTPIDVSHKKPQPQGVILRKEQSDAVAESRIAEPRDNPTRVLFLGRLVERKGASELVATLGELNKSWPDIYWNAIIAGRGPLLNELLHQVQQFGINDRVEFPGFIAEEDKAALLQSADIITLPATGGESFGISVVEALAASTGVVLAGDNPGYRTVMRGLEEQLVEPIDAKAFANKIAYWCEALQKPGLRNTIVQKQHEAAARFDALVIGQKIVYFYRQTQTNKAQTYDAQTAKPGLSEGSHTAQISPRKTGEFVR